MDHDAAALDDGGIAQGGVIISPILVVIDLRPAGLVPDLDAEAVHAPATIDLAVNGGEDEAVVAVAVDRAPALILRPRASYHQPLVRRAPEVQLTGLELELGVAPGDIGPFPVFRLEAERGLAGYSGPLLESGIKRARRRSL